MSLVIFAALLALGTWQVQRLHWKQGLIAERNAAHAAPPLELSEIPDNPVKAEIRRVRVAGIFLHDKEFLLGPRSFRSTPGLHVITPLRRDGGALVLVDRGWVPLTMRDPAARAAGQLRGRVTIIGVLRAGGRKSDWIPENDPDSGIWHYIDAPAMAARAGLSAMPDFVIAAGPAANPGGLPIGGRARRPLPNSHLRYAVTWYALAAVLLVIYVLYHVKRDDGAGDGGV